MARADYEAADKALDPVRKEVRKEVKASNKAFDETGEHTAGKDILPDPVEYDPQALHFLPSATARPNRKLSKDPRSPERGPDKPAMAKPGAMPEEIAKAEDINIENGRLSDIEEDGLKVLENDEALDADEMTTMREAQETVDAAKEAERACPSSRLL